jgi:hypothetical protein
MVVRWKNKLIYTVKSECRSIHVYVVISFRFPGYNLLSGNLVRIPTSPDSIPALHPAVWPAIRQATQIPGFLPRILACYPMSYLSTTTHSTAFPLMSCGSYHTNTSFYSQESFFLVDIGIQSIQTNNILFNSWILKCTILSSQLLQRSSLSLRAILSYVLSCYTL